MSSEQQAGPGEECVDGEIYEYPFAVEDFHGETICEDLDSIPPFLDRREVDTLALHLEAEFEDGIGDGDAQILVEVLRKLPDSEHGRGELPPWIVRGSPEGPDDG